MLHSSADIQERVIHFGVGAANDKLLEVPLGEIDPDATIVITVGLNRSHPNTANTDSDIRVGISDGTKDNIQEIVDKNNYNNYPPCYPVSGAHDDVRVATTTQVSSTFKLMFSPIYKYGACETAQEEGYLNTGTFNDQIDSSKPLFLRVARNHAWEQYYLHFLIVEIY